MGMVLVVSKVASKVEVVVSKVASFNVCWIVDSDVFLTNCYNLETLTQKVCTFLCFFVQDFLILRHYSRFNYKNYD